jgi:FtsH-binding integral membrane protein
MKIFKYILLVSLIHIVFMQLWFAAPDVECGNLPGCSDAGVSWTSLYEILWNVIALLIKYVAVIAVIAVMFGGIMYLISSWDEEKIKKAKSIIIWALVWVFISISAWSLINIINNFRI